MPVVILCVLSVVSLGVIVFTELEIRRARRMMTEMQNDGHRS